METKDIREWIEALVVNLAFLTVFVLLSPLIIIECLVRWLLKKE